MICEARNPGSLLHHALHQLYLNWSTSRGREKRLCWWGRMRSMLRRIWPQSDLHFHGDSLTATGNAQSSLQSRKIYRRNDKSKTENTSKRFTCTTGNRPPTIIYSTQSLSRIWDFGKISFLEKQSASINAVHALVCTFA